MLFCQTFYIIKKTIMTITQNKAILKEDFSCTQKAIILGSSTIVTVLSLCFYFFIFYSPIEHSSIQTLIAINSILGCFALGLITSIVLMGIMETEVAENINEQIDNELNNKNNDDDYWHDIFKQSDNQQEIFAIMSDFKNTIK